jgi:hypothetical protein
MVHRTNLAVEPLSNLPMVEKLETLSSSVQLFHHELQEISRVPETCQHRGNRRVTHAKKRKDPVDQPLGATEEGPCRVQNLGSQNVQGISYEETSLIPKQQASKESAEWNLDSFCDISTLLALPCMMPLLDSVNSLMKFAQSADVFISDYVVAVKIYTWCTWIPQLVSKSSIYNTSMT